MLIRYIRYYIILYKTRLFYSIFFIFLNLLVINILRKKCEEYIQRALSAKFSTGMIIYVPQ